MILQIALGLWMSAVIVATFLWLPPGNPQLGWLSPDGVRIIIFHVPNAMIAVVAFLVSTVYAVKYLSGHKLMDDAKSAVSAELGLMFTLLATITGAVFAKVEWGVAWNWDPRETTILILLLIYAAYFALRSATEGADRRATLASAYAIIAFATVPFLVFILPRLSDQSLHPKQAGLDSQYRMVLGAAMVGFLGLYLWLFRLGAALAELRLRKKGV